MIFDNKTYDILKKIALYIAPFATFIGALCTIWNIPYSEQITLSLAAFDTFVGSIVVASSKKYHKKTATETEADTMGKGDENE